MFIVAKAEIRSTFFKLDSPKRLTLVLYVRKGECHTCAKKSVDICQIVERKRKPLSEDEAHSWKSFHKKYQLRFTKRCKACAKRYFNRIEYKKEFRSIKEAFGYRDTCDIVDKL